MFVVSGPITIEGYVLNSVTALKGDVTILGHVGGDVVAFAGRVLVGKDAAINGDLITKNPPIIRAGAVISGKITRTSLWRPRLKIWFLSRWWIWASISISSLVLGWLLLLLAPRLLTGTYEAARTSSGPAIGWGAVLSLGLPLFAGVAVVTLIAFPLGAALFLGLALVYWVGYATTGYLVGRVALRGQQKNWLSMLVGVALLRGLELVPRAGGYLTLIGSGFGLGILSVVYWRTRRIAVVRNAPTADRRPG